ncbi:MAG: metal-dependent hydrolase, partial [Fluviibacter sp.]
MEIDPGPVQIQARNVRFDVSASPLHWIPGHPVASNVISLLNLVLPAAERWFVATYNEALPLVKDPRLAEDMRGFIGQEAVHADTHERMLRDWMEARGVKTEPVLELIDFVFEKMLAPSTSADPKRRLNHL